MALRFADDCVPPKLSIFVVNRIASSEYCEWFWTWCRRPIAKNHFKFLELDARVNALFRGQIVITNSVLSIGDLETNEEFQDK
jgi:hypothetical protein